MSLEESLDFAGNSPESESSHSFTRRALYVPVLLIYHGMARVPENGYNEYLDVVDCEAS